MGRRVSIVRIDVSEEHIASIIREKRISELETTLTETSKVLQFLVHINVVPSSLILFNLMMEAIRSPDKSALTRAKNKTFFIVTAMETSNLTHI
jgi:hypothetical protein